MVGVLSVLFVLVCVYCVFGLLSSCGPYVASFAGLFSFDYTFRVLCLTFIYLHLRVVSILVLAVKT